MKTYKTNLLGVLLITLISCSDFPEEFEYLAKVDTQSPTLSNIIPDENGKTYSVNVSAHFSIGTLKQDQIERAIIKAYNKKYSAVTDVLPQLNPDTGGIAITKFANIPFGLPIEISSAIYGKYLYNPSYTTIICPSVDEFAKVHTGGSKNIGLTSVELEAYFENPNFVTNVSGIGIEVYDFDTEKIVLDNYMMCSQGKEKYCFSINNLTPNHKYYYIAYHRRPNADGYIIHYTYDREYKTFTTAESTAKITNISINNNFRYINISCMVDKGNTSDYTGTIYAYGHSLLEAEDTLLGYINYKSNGSKNDYGGKLYLSNNQSVFKPYSDYYIKLVYRVNDSWPDLAETEYFTVPSQEPVDMGVSVKWASMNYGAIKCSEYGEKVNSLDNNDYWTVPTKEQYEELITNCHSSIEMIDGVSCIKYTSPITNNYIVFPYGNYLSNTSYVSGWSTYYYYLNVNSSVEWFSHKYPEGYIRYVSK